MAQSSAVPAVPSEGTPWQRLLPPPKAFSGQHDAQAKLLSRLRDFIDTTPSQSLSPPALSDDEIQSLKQAMKLFGGKLPEGLSPDILDSIPPELISKALSNPELMRQAKEMADQVFKDGRPNSNADPTNNPATPMSPSRPSRNTNPRDESPSQPKTNNPLPSSRPSDPANATNPSSSSGGTPDAKPQPTANSNDRDRNANQPDRQSTQPASQQNANDFRELMDKLLKTQQQFEQSKKERNDAVPNNDSVQDDFPFDTLNNPNPTDNPFKERQPDGASSPGSSPTSSRASPPAAASSARSENAPGASGPSGSTRNRAGSTPNPPSQSQAESARNEALRNRYQPPANGASTNPSSSPSKATNASNAPNASNVSNAPNAGRTGRTPPASGPDSQDIRKEIDRKGFGPALQKIIEDAKAKVAQRPKPNASTADDPSQSRSNRSGEDQGKSPARETSDRSTNAPNTASRPPSVDPNAKSPSPRSPQPESGFSKGVKQAGNYLNTLWTQIAKSTEVSTRVRSNASSASSSAPSSSAPTSSAQSSPGSASSDIPNLFRASALPYLAAILIVGGLTILALRYRVRVEQVRKEKGQAAQVPSIDEIRTRDDLVVAFHALAKKRFKAAQAWWTSGYVAQQFEAKMPQLKTPIQTLSGLYDQARYYPTEFQLTAKQIDEAKLALKQCEG